MSLSSVNSANLFMTLEAAASCALDDECVTVSEGLTHNPKLFKILVKVQRRETGEVVWRGPLAHAIRQSPMRYQ